MLVTICDADHVATALAEINEFFAYRGRRCPRARASDEVLGIRLCRDLDAGLPDIGVPIRESVAISGLWCLSWIDGELFRTENDARERRRRLLDTLSERRGLEPRAILPVFDAEETIEAIETMLEELRVGYAEAVSTTWFLDHEERGLIMPRSTSSSGKAACMRTPPTTQASK